MDEKINVELWEIPLQNVGFGAMEIEIALEVTTQFVYGFVPYYGAKITLAGESIVVVVQGVDEMLNFSWQWRSVADDLYQGKLVQD
jgi:hypothetical protein